MASGWTAASLTPKDPSLGSRVPTPVLRPEDVPQSAVGPINAYASMPITAANLATYDPSYANDPTLASRTLANPLTGARQVAARVSTFGGGNVPAQLQNAIANLNAEQAMRRSAQAELTNRIFQQAAAGGPDAYLWQEALRAISVNPGAHVNFGAAITSPQVGQAYSRAAQAYADKTTQNALAVAKANNAQMQLNRLQRQRSSFGPTPFGFYQNSPQQKLDQQILDLTIAASPTSSTQMLGRSAARGTSGWVPALPTY